MFMKDRWVKYHNLLKEFEEKSQKYLDKVRKQIQEGIGYLCFMLYDGKCYIHLY